MLYLILFPICLGFIWLMGLIVAVMWLFGYRGKPRKNKVATADPELPN